MTTSVATTKRYVEYLYGGLIAPETSAKELVGDTLHLELPKGALAWRTFERAATSVDGEALLGPVKNRSGWHYYGRRLTLAQVERELPHEQILIDNMRSSGAAAIVQTPSGRCFELRDGDQVLAPR